MSPRRVLQIAGTAELVTLVLMLVNIAPVHLPEVSRVLGPTHGLAYTATVITAILVMGGRHQVWLLAITPGIGGILASRAASPEQLERRPLGDGIINGIQLELTAPVDQAAPQG